ncbi:MAG: hypothetical protein WBZ29_17580 [Methanocella sp.]
MKIGKSAVLGISTILVSVITLVPFYLYCLLLLVYVLSDGEWGLLYLYLPYIIVFYVVFRNMRIDKKYIWSSIVISAILFLYGKYFEICKPYVNITLFQDISNVITDIFGYINQLELSTGFVPKAIVLFGLRELLIFSLFVIASYIYLLNYLEKRPLSVHDMEQGESKLNEFSFSAVKLYEAFNLFIFFSLFSYLIHDSGESNRFVEIVIVSSLLFITYLLFKNVVNTSRRITRSYDHITEINEENPIDLITKNTGSGEGRLRERIADVYTKVMPDLNYYIDLIPFYPKVATWVIRTIPLAAFTLGFIGYVLQFNVLSILYIELTLLGWYSLMCISLNIPGKKVDIILTNGHPFNNVYIIDDLSPEYLLVIDQKNVQIKIMKGSIMTIISPSQSDQIERKDVRIKETVGHMTESPIAAEGSGTK